MPVKFIHIMGARPNFIKVAPVWHKIGGLIIHTGQHYDDRMSGNLLKQLGLTPDYNLGCTHVPDMVMQIKKVLRHYPEASVLVYGDTNSTLAGAIAAKEMGNELIHIEAGLRSGDWTMPEESNRYVVDHLADMHLTSCYHGSLNLGFESVPGLETYQVGNVMIDTLEEFLPRTKNPAGSPYGLLTLHRPSNVNDPQRMEVIMKILEQFDIGIFWPVHPRVELPYNLAHNILTIPPQDYLSFLSLERFAKFVVTDSGGVQEETSHLGVPCLTVRPNTERPITVEQGTNTLVEPNGNSLGDELIKILRGQGKKGYPIWDGKAASRIAEVLL